MFWKTKATLPNDPPEVSLGLCMGEHSTRLFYILVNQGVPEEEAKEVVIHTIFVTAFSFLAQIHYFHTADLPLKADIGDVMYRALPKAIEESNLTECKRDVDEFLKNRGTTAAELAADWAIKRADAKEET